MNIINLKYVGMTTDELKMLRRELVNKQLNAARRGRDLDIDADIQRLTDEINDRKENRYYTLNNKSKHKKNP